MVGQCPPHTHIHNNRLSRRDGLLCGHQNDILRLLCTRNYAHLNITERRDILFTLDASAPSEIPHHLASLRTKLEMCVYW